MSETQIETPIPAPKFPLGDVVMTRGIAAAIARDEFRSTALQSLLAWHETGTWGDVSPNDARANDEAVSDGDRILSAYYLGNTRVWVITEGDRSVTTILLPEEY